MLGSCKPDRMMMMMEEPVGFLGGGDREGGFTGIDVCAEIKAVL